MQCFNVERGVLRNEIAVDKSFFADNCMCLGSCGEKSHLAVLPFFHPNPPLILEDDFGSCFFKEAHPVIPRGSDFYTLARPNNAKDSRILVRTSHYECRVMSGSATEIGFGFTMIDEGTCNYFYESMRVLTPGTVLFLREQCSASAETLALIAGNGEARLMKLEEFLEKVSEYERSHNPES